MKNKNFLKNLVLTLLPASMLSVVVFGFAKSKSIQANAYSESNLPTTIDLNDTSVSDIRNYYSSLSSLDENERKGNNLLKNLKSILKNGQKYYSYDSGSDIWKIYEISDRDWNKSPETEISGYNSQTKKITGYQYGSSYSNPGTNPFIHALYVNRSTNNLIRAWKKDNDTQSRNNHGNNAEWYIDREHIWPKSHGFEEKGAGGARGDPMHLWPGDSDVNSSAHNNNFYGYVDLSKDYSVGKWSYAKDNYRGDSLTLNQGESVFEPQDCDKGDIARAIFYMVARYNYLSGEDDGISTNNPNLTLVQDNTFGSAFTSTTSNPGKMGILTDLLAWHHADPVDYFEIHRNNLLYKNFTNNRNPFIDFPEWVDFIWGKATYNGRNYQSYSSTPTGYAKPSSDIINGYNGESTNIIQATSVTIKNGSTTISGSFEPSTPYFSGGTLDLTSSFVSYKQGTGYQNGSGSISWSSSNTNVASIDNGIVTFIGKGTCTISATALDKGANNSTISSTFTLNLSNLLESSGTLSNPYSVSQARAAIDSGTGTTGVYATGKVSSIVTAYSTQYKNISYDISENGLTSENQLRIYRGVGSSTYSINSTDSIQVGDVVVVYGNLTKYNNSIYEFEAGNKTISCERNTTISSISVLTQSLKTTYNSGDYFDPEGLVILVTYSDGTTENVSYDDNEDSFDFSPTSTLSSNTSSVTVYFGGKSTNVSITVTSSGGSGTTSFSQRIVSNANSPYMETGAIYPTGDANSGSTTCEGFNVLWEKNNNQSGVVYTYDQLRIYKYHSFAITPKDNFIIDSVDIFVSTDDYASALGSESLLNCTKTVNDLKVTLTPTDGSSQMKFINDAQSRVNYMVVYYESEQSTFSLVSNVNDLGTGDEIVFVGNYTNSSYFEPTTMSSGSYLSTVEISAPVDGKVELNSSAKSFIIEKSDNYFRFKDLDNGYISTKSEGGNNMMYENVSSPTTKSLFSLLIENNNVSSLQGCDTTINERYIRFNYNSGNPRFSCYSTPTNSYSFAIYKKTYQVQADAWASEFLNSTQNCNISNWNSLANSFNNLCLGVKNEIINCVANSSADYSKRSQAMARYEYILNDSRFSGGISNFIAGRNVSNIHPSITLFDNNFNNTVLFVLLCLVSTSSIVFFMYLRHRKYEEE